MLTPPATIAAGSLNKELTPIDDLNRIFLVITIRLVNGILMANHAFSHP
jgi:hypothetical protein